ncbi:hypothetical protein DFH11DRAFT_1593832 [Phellopilus nigrolimitatus]|nr:hypothetical protein DFH11DRAFT_1593832 [Phellopilus nigrolimitatus]
MTSRRRVVVLGQGKNSTASMPPTSLTSSFRPRNPKYIPPLGNQCPIEEVLPPEVLAYIFELGTQGEENSDEWDEVEEDDGDEAYEDVDSDDESDFGVDSMRVGKVKITDDTDDGEGDTAEFLPFQVRMSHVCRRWRQVAIDTPVLWSRLSFSEPPPFDKSKEWILRSKQSPLDINIDVTLPEEAAFPMVGLVDTEQNTAEDSSKHTDAQKAKETLSEIALQDIGQIMDLIIPHVSRWRTFELSVSTYAHMYFVLNQLGKCSADPGAPILETFSLFCYDDSEDTGFERFVFDELRTHFMPFGGYVPKLAQVGLWGVHLDWSIFIPPSERSVEALQTLPSTTTSLTDIELAYHAKDVRPTSHIDPLFLPTLRNLRLAFLDEDYASKLLRQLYAPGLTSISLDFDESDFTEFIHRLVAPKPMPLSPPPISKYQLSFLLIWTLHSESRTIDPSKPASILANVTDVKLSGMPCADASAGVFYAACPRLKRLYLNMHFLPLSFFTLLMQQTEIERTTVNGRPVEAARIVMPEGPQLMANSASRGALVCTRLETLTVSGMDGDALVTLVKTRKALGAPLRELNVDEMDTVTDDDLEWLEANVEDVNVVEISDDEGESVEGDEDEEDENGEGVDEEDGGGEGEGDGGNGGAEAGGGPGEYFVIGTGLQDAPWAIDSEDLD